MEILKLIPSCKDYIWGGHRLAEELGIEYYDREILSKIVERTSFTERYIKEVESRLPHRLFPITIGRSFFIPEDQNINQVQMIFNEQSQIIEELADRSNCVIVGRCADYVLRGYHPFRIFVYADMESKIRRCQKRSDEGERLTEDEIRKQVDRIDRNRSKYYTYHTEQKWGKKENYDLCINTSDIDIKELVPILAQLFKKDYLITSAFRSHQIAISWSTKIGIK